MIKATACGTPVVAFRCGSVSEVIEDGRTSDLNGCYGLPSVSIEKPFPTLFKADTNPEVPI
jgi:hypothetical protein